MTDTYRPGDVDEAATNFMKAWFPREVAEKDKENESDRRKEEVCACMCIALPCVSLTGVHQMFELGVRVTDADAEKCIIC